MDWFRKHIWEIGLNGLALLVVITLLVRVMQETTGYLVPQGWRFIPHYRTMNIIGDPVFRDFGHWAIRFLLVSLAMTPLYILTGWRPALRLRKPAGLWAFALATGHVWLFASDITWGKSWTQSYTRLGLAAFIILALLAATSHRPAMRLLKRNWKRLHRLVYGAGVLVILHGLLAASHWAKLPSASATIWEMRVYCVILVLLLMLRVPMVRVLLQRPPRKAKRQPEYAGILD